MLKHNKPLQCYIASNASDKLAQQLGSQAIINTMLNGILDRQHGSCHHPWRDQHGAFYLLCSLRRKNMWAKRAARRAS